MPILPPTEDNPFAQPGKWVFVNEQWLSIVYGTLSYALRDSFWIGNQDETAQVIQSVLTLMDGIGELMPPENRVEVVRLVADENQEICEYGECEVANCNCVNSVRFCDGTLEYKGEDGLWHAIPLSVASVENPDVPAEEDLPLPVGDNACQKAWAVWEAFELYVDGLLQSVPGWDIGWVAGSIGISFPKNPIKWIADFKAEHGELPINNAQTFLKMSQWFISLNVGGVNEDWQLGRDVLRDEIICAMMDTFSKDAKLTETDLGKWKAYTFASVSGDLLDFLFDVQGSVIADKHLQERAVSYVLAQENVCDCVGSEPAPIVPEGYAQLEVMLTYSAQTTVMPESHSTPNALLAVDDFVWGVKLADDHYQSSSTETEFDNQGLGVLLRVPAGVKITRVVWSLDWLGETDARTGDVGLYKAASEAAGWETMAEVINQSATTWSPGVVADNAVSGTHRFISIMYTTYGTPDTDANHIDVSNLRCDLAAVDGSWTRLNVPAGTVFPL